MTTTNDTQAIVEDSKGWKRVGGSYMATISGIEVVVYRGLKPKHGWHYSALDGQIEGDAYRLQEALAAARDRVRAHAAPTAASEYAGRFEARPDTAGEGWHIFDIQFNAVTDSGLSEATAKSYASRRNLEAAAPALLARAESAEAQVAVLREALESVWGELDTLDLGGLPSTVMLARNAARAALSAYGDTHKETNNG